MRLSKELWTWCLQRNITIKAQHLPRHLNQVADSESRTMLDRSDWKLDSRVFQQIHQLWGPMEVDLFASRLTTQCPVFFSWQPDPYAAATDAFLQVWTYANPPWNLVGRVAAQAQAQQASMVLVAPVWWTQPWYPILLEMMVDAPHLIPPQRQATSRSQMRTPQLAAWPIPGKKCRDHKLSKEASSLIFGSWREKTNKSYNSHFGRWHSWCSRRGTNPFSGPVTDVANFLAELFTEGYKYNSLNAYRSAISSVHEKVEGYEVGQHPLITRLIKGVFNT